MKKVTLFDGSPRKRHTNATLVEFIARLHDLGGVGTEIVRLADFRIGTCRGCQNCLGKGEEHCPLRDDRDLLLAKLMASDGVVFASPNYSFQVSGVMKIFLDRLGFLFHRPRLHGRTFTSIVVQGIYGGGKIVDYLDFVGHGLGFHLVKGACCTTRDPMTEREVAKRSKVLADLARRFHAGLFRPSLRKPTMRELMVFRLSRTGIHRELDESFIDYEYYATRGWFDSGYYYPVHLGWAQRAAGRLFDWTGARLAQPRVRDGVAPA